MGQQYLPFQQMLTGEAYKASAEMAGIVGPFPKYNSHSENMLRVMNNHKKAAYDSNDYEGISHDLIAIDQEICPEYLLEAAQLSWDDAVELGTKNGYRNAQAQQHHPRKVVQLLTNIQDIFLDRLQLDHDLYQHSHLNHMLLFCGYS
jgi:ribonucleoside-diphosphate reductase alpha chain